MSCWLAGIRGESLGWFERCWCVKQIYDIGIYWLCYVNIRSYMYICIYTYVYIYIHMFEDV